MKKLVAPLMAGLLLAGGASAFAAPKATPEEAFKKLDANNDGKLSLEEFKAGKGHTEAAFKALDKDNDGSLTLDEFKATPAKKPKKPA